MFALLALGVAWVVSRKLHDDGSPILQREDMHHMMNPSLSIAREPLLIEDDLDEKSFAAAQRDNTVRMPFGPNPQTHYVNAPEMVQWPAYRTHYKSNLFTMTVDPQAEWRFDEQFTTALVNTAVPHMPEDYPGLYLNAGVSNFQSPPLTFDKSRQ